MNRKFYTDGMYFTLPIKLSDSSISLVLLCKKDDNKENLNNDSRRVSESTLKNTKSGHQIIGQGFRACL